MNGITRSTAHTTAERCGDPPRHGFRATRRVTCRPNHTSTSGRVAVEDRVTIQPRCHEALGQVAMGKARKQSLASRKRSKDFSSALAENAYKYDPRSVEKFNDAAVPRSMRNLMRSIQMVKDAEAGKDVRHYKSREDMPPKPKPEGGYRKGKKRKAGEDDAPAVAEALAAPPPTDSDAAAAEPETQSAKKRRKKKQKQLREARVATMPPENFSKGERSGSSGGVVSKGGAKFGETNDRPPELMLSGQLAKRAAQLAGATSAQERALALQRETVMKNYANAKAKRSGGEVPAGKKTFAAPFLSFPV